MSPILGIWASSIQPSLSAGSFESIATVTVGAGGTSSITFTSIPQTYTHLQLRWMVRSTYADVTSWQNMTFNAAFNSGTTGYVDHYLRGNGSTASSGFENLQNKINYGESTGANSGANMFGVGIIDILDYSNTNKNKTVRMLDGHDQNGSGAIFLRSGLWASTSAITSIYLGNSDYSANFAQYSSYALYGIKGA